jgi:hypothetical protein
VQNYCPDAAHFGFVFVSFSVMWTSAKTEGMHNLNDVARVGKFRKVSYKFVREGQESLNRIELKLYDSQLQDRVNEEDLAKTSASRFVQCFSPGSEYKIIDVWLINRGNSSMIHDAIFTFSIKEL